MMKKKERNLRSLALIHFCLALSMPLLQDAAAKVGTAALAQLYGTNYVVGSSTNVLCKY